MAYFGFNERLHQMDTCNCDDRRLGGRIMCLDLRCSMGQVLDLSSTGMRVLAKKIYKGQPIMIHMADDQGDIMLKAEAVWVKPKTRRGTEVGLRFVEMEPHLRSRIAGLARDATNQLMMNLDAFDKKPGKARRRRA